MTLLKELKANGVYAIRNIVNNHIYIGSANQGFHKRWDTHKSHLRVNKHKNAHLQAAWNKYGEKSFEFFIVEQVEGDKEAVYSVEQYYLDLYHGRPFCYNINSKATGGVKDRRVKEYKFNLIGSDGTKYENITNLSKFAREHELSIAHLHQLARGRINSCRGFTIEILDLDLEETRQRYKKHRNIVDREKHREKSVELRRAGLMKNVGRPSLDPIQVEMVILIKAFFPNFSLRKIANLPFIKMGYVSVKNILDDNSLPIVKPISYLKDLPDLNELKQLLKQRILDYNLFQIAESEDSDLRFYNV